MSGALNKIVVVDLSVGVSGPFMTKFLADQGATVIKIEPPSGDPSRQLPPFLNNDNPTESSAHFLFLNTDKKSVTVNLESSDGQKVLDQLVSGADLVVENFSPSDADRLKISYDRFSSLNPRIILTSITPFGRIGPYRDYQVEDIVIQAMGGMQYMSGGFAQEPMQMAFNQGQLSAGRSALVPTLAALYYQSRTGQGQHVDVSAVASMVMYPPAHIIAYSYSGTVTGRGPLEKNVMDGDFLESQDGWVCLTTGGGNTMEQWAIFFDMPELLAPEFETAALRAQNWEVLDEMFRTALMKWKKHDFMTAVMDQRFVVGVVQTPEEIIQCPQLGERGSMIEITHPVAGSYKYPGAGYLVDGVNPLIGSGCAPLLGQHTQEVLEAAGFNAEEQGRLRDSKVIL